MLRISKLPYRIVGDADVKQLFLYMFSTGETAQSTIEKIGVFAADFLTGGIYSSEEFEMEL